jgi:hypothetical protein
MDTLLKPIAPDVLKKLFLSDDLTTDFIKNTEYSSNQNVINAATVLLSYYMNMNNVNKLLSDSQQKKDDLELRMQLLTYVSEQKKEIDKVDNNKIIDAILNKKGKKSRSKKSRRNRRFNIKKL